jgi:RNA polymerase sigma-70 factor (ECF subfamily)
MGRDRNPPEAETCRSYRLDGAGLLALYVGNRWPSLPGSPLAAGMAAAESGLAMYDRPVQDGEHGGHPVSEAFDELFDAYEQRIFNLVYRLVGDYEDAADLTSETFVRALRGYDRFRGEAQLYTWLYRIAVNLCKNYFRQQQHRSRVHAFSLDAPIEGEEGPGDREIEDVGQEPQRVVEAREMETQVQRCLLQLRPDFRSLIVMRDMQGLSYKEIGEILGCPEKAVKSRLFRARGKLRELLEPYLSGS